MTAPTGLGQYNKPQGSQGDRVQAQQMVDRPILVWVRKLQHLNRTKYSAEGGDAIYIDFIDLQSNQVYIEVMWMAGAIVDGLKQYAGDGNAYPIKVVRVQGGQWGSYQTIESLSEDPQWMNHVMANLPTFQQMVAQTRAQKEQEWAIAMQQANQPPQVPGGPPPAPALAPVGTAVPPFQQPGQQAQYGAPAAAPPQQFQQAPSTQQPGQYAPTPEFQQTAAQYGVPQQPAAQVPAGPPPQYQQQQYQQQQYQQQQVPPAQPQQQAPAAPPVQPGYQPQQYQAPQQQFAPAAPPQAAVAPPQYGAPAAPVGPPGPPQQFQQAGPPPAPAQQFAPQGPPQPPGAVTGQSVADLQAQLNAIG